MDEVQKVIVDEIKYYMDCRYVSACDVSWRIFGYVIQYNEPPIIRLSIHLPDQQSVIFEDEDNMETVIEKAASKFKTLQEWFEANKKHESARTLTYAQFPTKFVFSNGFWSERKSGYSIGRVYSVHPNVGELYYLRVLLNNNRGARGFVDLRKVDGVTYPTFKEACFAMGLLDDDKEYIEAIKEASVWSSAAYVRRFFAMLIINGSISCPAHVWESTWSDLSDDIIIKQRHIVGDLGIG